MPFQRLKFPASNRTVVVGVTPAGTEADEDEAMAPTAVESWREDDIAAAAERTRGGGGSDLAAAAEEARGGCCSDTKFEKEV
jgi:hypothetical protein